MNDSITYQVHSKDPNNYGRVSFSPDIPWNTHKIEYKVLGINTFSNFLITNSEDYLKITVKKDTGDKEYTYTNFAEKCSYEIDELVTLLNERFSDSNITVELLDSNVLSFSCAFDFSITDCSHRLKLLLGAYHQQLPIESKNKVLTLKSTPMLNYGNVLYLKSNQGNALGVIIENGKYHAPCIYRISTFLKPGLPIISDKKGDKVIVNAEAAKVITMELVDFMYEPIALKSPLFITLKIKLIPHQTFN